MEFNVQESSDLEGSVLEPAQKQYDIGNYNEAIRLLNNALTTDPSPDNFILLGNCYYKMNAYIEALKAWEHAIDLDAKNPTAFTNIGNLYFRTGDVEKAVSYWLAALISKPEDAVVSLNLAVAFGQKNMRFEAIKYYEKYLKYSEDKSSQEYKQIQQKITRCYAVANEYLKTGVQFQSQGDDKKAAACYFKSLANYPNFSKTNLNLGSIFFMDRNLELAIKYWRAASYIEPNYAKIYANLAISYDLKREFDYAYCYYHRYMNYVINDKDEYYKARNRLYKIKPYLNKNQDLIEVHLAKAQEHVGKSEYYEAIDEFTNYSILKPESAENYKELINKIKSYIEPERQIIENCFEIGNNLMAQSNYAEAKKYFYRIMLLSSPQFLEFTKAKAKFSQCQKFYYGDFE